ncbi:hypothetical protein [uncultured Prevotella sp.]|uniref:hypothetical protein n=1 Tax=uncultured Prevotella sp. TaxID=159272 RepID=UPI0025DF3291|nr:hypothetical protein [uncultured Prevotella sp.]
MKKSYITPEVNVIQLESMSIMAGSGGGTVSNPLSKPDPFESTSSTPSTASFDMWDDTEVAE